MSNALQNCNNSAFINKTVRSNILLRIIATLHRVVHMLSLFVYVVIPIPGQTAGLPVQLNSGKQCDDFIYPILDWGNQPLVAGLTVVSGMVLVPFVHLFWMVVTYIRREIYTLLQHKFRS